MTTRALSKRQHQLQTFIAAYIIANGYPPLQSEMASHLKTSISNVNAMLFILEDRGWLIHHNGWIRAWGVVPPVKRGAA